jgi:hypothetical protein
MEIGVFPPSPVIFSALTIDIIPYIYDDDDDDDDDSYLRPRDLPKGIGTLT